VRVILVGVGGFVGSVLRYWMSGLAHSAAPTTAFPIGTLAVNVVGCLAIGVISELAEARGFLTPDMRALLVVGLLGGFTTFSAFANESVNAVRDGAHAIALANVLLSVGVCLIAVWAGRSLAHSIWR
jgi:fluoride exporter